MNFISKTKASNFLCCIVLDKKGEKIYIYTFLCYCVCVCLCFKWILTSTDRPFKWTDFLTFHHENVYTPHLYFHFLITRKILWVVQIMNHLIVQSHPPSINSSILEPNIRIYSRIIHHSYVSLNYLLFFKTNGFTTGYLSYSRLSINIYIRKYLKLLMII